MILPAMAVWLTSLLVTSDSVALPKLSDASLEVVALSALALSLILIGLAFGSNSNRLVQMMLALAAALVLLASMGLQAQPEQETNTRALANGFRTANVRFETADYAKPLQGGFSSSSSFRTRVCLLWVSERGPVSSKRSCGQLVGDESLVKYPPGSLLRAQLSFRPPFRTGKDLFSAKLESKPKFDSSLRGDESIVSKTKQALRNKATGITPDSRALVLGLSIGDDSQLSAGLKSDLKVVSLTHLTAVSGSNCAIVVAGSYFLLAVLRLRNWGRFIGSALALAGYVALVGPQASVLRAGAMALIVMAAHAIGRGVNALVALGLSVVLLLIYDPWMSRDLGFALSVAATAGLLLVAPAIYQKLRPRMFAWLAAGISVSVAAQIMCFPILLQLQNGFASYSVLANLLVEPVVAPVTILGILATLTVLICPPISSALTFVASFGTRWIIRVTDWLVDLPATTLAWPSGLLGTALALALSALLFVAFRSKQARLQRVAQASLAVALTLSLAIVASSNYRVAIWPVAGWQVVSCDVGQGDATVLQSEGHFAVIDVGREPKKIATCLDRLNIHRIELLVLTHYDLDHVGGLDSVLQNRDIDRILVSGFADDRPGAAISMRKVKATNAQVIVAETGLSGDLDSVHWIVLSPHRGAAEAEDSNDGSVTMLFKFSEFNFLALADLGEKGQMRLAEEWNQWHPQMDESKPLVLKVAHHGSADTYPEFIESLHPDISLISVGKNNGYGHPTKRALDSLAAVGSKILRTDISGSISLDYDGRPDSTGVTLRIRVSGAS